MFIKKQQGMTLLEVIVSMLVVGLGLVMTTMMLQVGNRYGTSAEYRASAIREMQSLIDMVQANVLGIDGYLFGDGNYKEGNYAINLQKPPVDGNIQEKCSKASEEKYKDKGKDKEIEKKAYELKCIGKSSALGQAYTEMTNWLQRVQTVVPNGQAAVYKDKKDEAGVYTVKIMWRISEAEQRAENQGAHKLETVEVKFTL